MFIQCEMIFFQPLYGISNYIHFNVLFKHLYIKEILFHYCCIFTSLLKGLSITTWCIHTKLRVFDYLLIRSIFKISTIFFYGLLIFFFFCSFHVIFFFCIIHICVPLCISPFYSSMLSNTKEKSNKQYWWLYTRRKKRTNKNKKKKQDTELKEPLNPEGHFTSVLFSVRFSPLFVLRFHWITFETSPGELYYNKHFCKRQSDV